MHECNGLGRHEPDLDSLLQKASLQGPQNIWMLVINKNVLWYFSIRFFYSINQNVLNPCKPMSDHQCFFKPKRK